MSGLWRPRRNGGRAGIAALQLPTDVGVLSGHGHEEWQCWLESVGARQIEASRGLVFDTLELTLAAAEEGHGVAIGDPRMARDRLQAGTLMTPFADVAQNGLSYFVVYPSQRAVQSKIRASLTSCFGWRRKTDRYRGKQSCTATSQSAGDASANTANASVQIFDDHVTHRQSGR